MQCTYLRLEPRVFHLLLTDGAVSEPKGDPWTIPPFLKHRGATVSVEDMSTAQPKATYSLFFYRISLLHECVLVAYLMEGMGQRASVKQIIHMSSPSCLRGGDRVTLLSEHPCRQGRHSVSPAMPPQGQPQAIIKETLVRCLALSEIRNESMGFQALVTQCQCASVVCV